MDTLFLNATFYDRGLKNTLEIKNSEVSDNELLCHAYEKWGEKMVCHLDGDFSFVLYDPERKYYFCARDPLGIKSLYFTKIKGNYTFSSNIDELLTLSDISKEPNLNSMRNMLYEHAVDYTDTMYEGIYRLPPGYFMTIENGEEKMERYWHPEEIKRNYVITEDEAAKQLHEFFIKAIDKRVSNLKETAFEVSGGLDSSSVVSQLSQCAAPPSIDSYSLDLKGLECDEGVYVDSILDQYPLRHQKIPTSNLDYRQTYSLAYLYTLSPNWPITLIFALSLPIYEKMQDDGKTIVITGHGGDHLFTGNPYVWYDLFRRLKFLTLYNDLRTRHKPWAAIKAYIIRPILGENMVRFIQTVLRRNKNETDPFLKQSEKVQDISTTTNIKNLTFKNDLDLVTSAVHSTLMDGNLLHCAEEHFGIEFRHPYFDLDLVEFALSLPPEFKYRRGKIKWIFRKAMQGILPDMIHKRNDKAEFSEMIMQQIDSLDMGVLLDNPYIVKLGLIDQVIINKYRKGYEDKTIKSVLILWRVINLEYWYRYNFEKESLLVSIKNEKH